MEPKWFMIVKGSSGTLLDGSEIEAMLCVIANMDNMLYVKISC